MNPKALVKAALASFGYEIRRRHEFGRLYENRLLWGELLCEAPGRFADVHRLNRQTLQQVACWLQAGQYGTYGVPEDTTDLDSANPRLTYSDVICYLSTFLTKPVRYLETGVSVGKNFYQVMNFVEAAELVAIEILPLSPVLADRLGAAESVTSWDALGGHPQGASAGTHVTTGSLSRYRDSRRRNTVDYLQGDLYADATWRALAGRKFNVVFSDAHHTGDAVRHEVECLLKYELLDLDGFVIVFDDLQYGLISEAFVDIGEKLKAAFGVPARHVSYLECDGSYYNQVQHLVGFVLNRPRM